MVWWTVWLGLSISCSTNMYNSIVTMYTLYAPRNMNMVRTWLCFWYCWIMMTSSSGNILHVTGPLWGGSTSNWRIPLTKASDTELWYFLWSVPEQTAAQTIETTVIWDAIALIMTSLTIIYPYLSGLFHWHWVNLRIAPYIWSNPERSG